MSSEKLKSQQFVAIGDLESLETLFERSQSAPVLLFKHSLTCPVSRAAYDELAHMRDEVSLIIVQNARDLSREIATRTGIRHESPQAIVLRNGKAVWHASHWNVTEIAVEEALRSQE